MPLTATIQSFATRSTAFAQMATRSRCLAVQRHSYSRLACLGLTQVCREIRKEFRPIFLESTPALLEDPSELCSYIETFYPTADAQVLEGYQGDITIRISPRQLPSTCTH
jgi:hypothetical protein